MLEVKTTMRRMLPLVSLLLALSGCSFAEYRRAQLAEQKGDWDQAVIFYLQLVQKQAPSIPTVYLTQEQKPEENIYRNQPSPWTAGFDPLKYAGSVPRAVKAAGGAIWSPLYEDIDSASIKEAHQLGLKVVVWTVNKAEDMARLMDMGVDGIISDNPDVLRAVAAKKGFALPAPAPVSP